MQMQMFKNWDYFHLNATPNAAAHNKHRSIASVGQRNIYAFPNSIENMGVCGVGDGYAV